MEQTTIRAIVRGMEGQDALVEVEQRGCGRCHETGGCGGQHLTQMFCTGPRHFRAQNGIGAQVGERVTVAVAKGSVRRTANLAYGLPLLGVLGGALLGALLGDEAYAMAGAGLGLLLALVMLHKYARLRTGNAAERPHIIART